VHVRISPFGDTGPYAQWRGADIVDQAVGGYLYLSGSPDREPLVGPADQPALAAGVYAAIGAMAALHARRRGRDGRDATVDVSHLDVLAGLHQHTDVRYTHTGDVLKRMGNRYAGPGSPIGMYRASDGFIAFTVATAAHGEVLLAVTGLDHLLELPGVNSVTDVMINASILDPALNGWLADQTVAGTVELLRSVRLAVAPVLSMSQVLDDEQLAARAWWRDADVEGRSVRIPGPPFHIGDWSWEAAPARALDGDEPPPLPDRPPGAVATLARECGPLDGLRVLDLTRVWAGPLAARILADLGADVVMVEAPWARTTREVPQAYASATHFFPDDDPGAHPWNRQGHINKYSIGKRSLGLDIATDAGRAAFERLVPHVDVVLENYSPRVMPNLGLDERRLHELNPSLLYVTMPGYGRTGPAKDHSAYGPVLDSHAGLSTLMGYRDVEAWKCGIAWPDPVAGIHGALAVLVALWGRDRTADRTGTTVEVAQFETAVGMTGDRLVRAQLDGADPRPQGNRHGTFAPQGVYRTLGDDRWIALTVPDDATWTALCELAGLPAAWHGWPVAQRRAEHDAIDDALGRWAAAQRRDDAVAALQAAGVPAGHVADAADWIEDPHLAERGYWAVLDHPESGSHRWPTFPARLSSSPTRPRGPAPLLGQHNAEVLREWGGLDEAEIADLVASGVVATEPPAT
jgi:crotonobetainyl-CoA:carnitine CoA-transferase CaiB-like acyl-CoA transferase